MEGDVNRRDEDAIGKVLEKLIGLILIIFFLVLYNIK